MYVFYDSLVFCLWGNHTLKYSVFCFQLINDCLRQLRPRATKADQPSTSCTSASTTSTRAGMLSQQNQR